MFDYAQLEEEIKKVIEVVEKLPSAYRTAAFEILLNVAIRDTMGLTIQSAVPAVAKPQSAAQNDLPIDVKAFLMQYTIPDEAIDRLFLRHGAEIRPIYKIRAEKKGTAQLQIALLTALENALKSEETKFEFSVERVRILCREQGKYDQPNFMKYFKTYKKLFGNLSDPEHVELSADGKSELADVVAELTK